MICYNCGSTLGSGRRCLRCGADVTVYRKIMRSSNNYYNAGLEKARLRDLTGAVSALRKSVQLNKNNTDARNLLGLVYYEMGEVTDALCQWIVSNSLQTENNRAEYYLNEMSRDRNGLDQMNQAVKKFNLALDQARNEGTDLAIITLKRVLKQQPRYIKAYQLLALLYINDEEYSKANRLLKKVLEMDRGNTLCLRYSRMIRGKIGKSAGARRKAEERRAAIRAEEERQASLQETQVDTDEDEVLIPKKRKHTEFFRTALVFLAGLVAALCLYQFVILRTVTHDSNVAANKKIASYDSQLADNELELSSMQEQVTQAQEEESKSQEEADSYAALMDIVSIYLNDDGSVDTDKLTEDFSKVKEDASDSDAYQAVYEAMKKYVTVDQAEKIYQEGKELYDTDYYTQAISSFEKCLEINPDYDKALYYIGMCYRHKDDNDTAAEYFAQLVQNCPDSEYYEEAKDYAGDAIAETTTSADGEDTSGDADSSDDGDAADSGEDSGDGSDDVE